MTVRIHIVLWFERSDKKLLRVAPSAMGTNRGSFSTMTPKIWNHHIVWGRVFWLHLKKKMELLIQYVSYSLTNFQWLPSGNKVVRRTRRAFSQIALSYYHLLRRVIKTFFVCWFAFVLLCVCLFVHLLVCLFVLAVVQSWSHSLMPHTHTGINVNPQKNFYHQLWLGY